MPAGGIDVLLQLTGRRQAKKAITNTIALWGEMRLWTFIFSANRVCTGENWDVGDEPNAGTRQASVEGVANDRSAAQFSELDLS